MYKFKEEVTKIAVTLAQKCPWSQKASNEVWNWNQVFQD